MNYVYYGQDLYHHGILGMKWGVRRYQNYDGSYTQAGLRRYNKAKTDYETAKSNATQAKTAYKQGTGSKTSYKQAKANVKSAKRQMNSAYDKLPQDKKADKGKKLYAQGKTINDNNADARTKAAVIGVGSSIAANLIAKNGNTETAAIAARTIRAGGIAVNSILGVKTRSENKKLRAYYGHSS